MGSFVSRNFINAVGLLYPAYATYKCTKTKTGQDRLLRYWAVMAVFLCLEYYMDVFVSWLPFYYECKLLFVLWLAAPQTRGSSIVWTNYMKPFLSTREERIDATISNAQSYVISQAKAIKQKAIVTAQTRFALFLTQTPNLAPIGAVVAPMLLSAAAASEAAAESENVAPAAQTTSIITELDDSFDQSMAVEMSFDENSSFPNGYDSSSSMPSSPLPKSAVSSAREAASCSPKTTRVFGDITNSANSSPNRSPNTSPGKSQLLPKSRKIAKAAASQKAPQRVKATKPILEAYQEDKLTYSNVAHRRRPVAPAATKAK